MPKSSSLADGAKTYYRPIEAAIRWSGLLRFERRILATLGQRPLPEATEFPRWPMLRLNTERIFDALAHGEMPYGKEGLVRDTQGLTMDDLSLTVRHVDLKSWMAHYYPGEKPAFLFDEIERALHPAISWTQWAHCWPSGKRSRRGWRNTWACTRRCAPSTRRC